MGKEKDIIIAELVSDESPKFELDIVEEENIDTEFSYVQTNIINMIEDANTVLSSSSKLAIETDSPRAIEVYTGLVKNIADLNKDLLRIRKDRNDLLGKTSESKGTTNIRNAVFVGSTQELYKLMQNEK